ncbi:MAG: alpha-glucan family phosphorylase [bacterium]
MNVSSRIQVFNVAVAVPAELQFLETLSRNMWWCWNRDAVELFRRISPTVWRESGHSPLDFLSRIPQKRLEALVEDDGFMSHLQQVQERFEAEVLSDRDGKPHIIPHRCIAYFSLEYGIHESIRLYSGGLGVLAGDHLKSASDMNLPLVAVGLLYRQGYHQQYLNNDGWQQEKYVDNEINRLPLVPAYNKHKQPIRVELPIPSGILRACVWRMDIGRVPLFLMDTNVPENPPELRRITANLYGGDQTVRILQELLLGICGHNILLEMGFDPAVCHMNEGHASFVPLARFAHLCSEMKLDLKTARQIVERTCVFTTHTPVSAGNETFPVGLLRPHLESLRHTLRLDPDQVLSWGQAPGGGQPHELQMTVLGMRMSHSVNAVSKIHGRVARKMWAYLWPDKPESEVPIRHITNGIHVASWLSPDMTMLYDRYLGPDWRDAPASEHVLSAIEQIPDEELWRAHELARARLMRRARVHTEQQFMARNASNSEISQAKSVLEPNTLTIGFARRFASYKRAILILRDRRRLEALLGSPDRGIQLVFAGKAHPADDLGKDFIRQIVQFARQSNVRKRVVFLEDYDMYLARDLVQGVDIWLNTPRRSLEASGTSGMKAAVNGVLNLSSMDGWWCEGYNPDCGWAIGDCENYSSDHEYEDTVESLALYNMLENEVIPAFYDKEPGEAPARWLKMMKASMKMALGQFTSHRMTSEYNAMFYQPSLKRYENLVASEGAKAREFVAHSDRLSALWPEVRIEVPRADRDLAGLHVGDSIGVTAKVHLGRLQPGDVDVEVYSGIVNADNEITESRVSLMQLKSTETDGSHTYGQTMVCKATGRHGFTARVTPRGSEWKDVMPGFIVWASGG